MNPRKARHLLLVLALLAGAILALPGVGAAAPAKGAAATPTIGVTKFDRDLLLIAATASTPGFGGAYVDEATGKLNIWTTDADATARTRTAMASVAGLAQVFGPSVAELPTVAREAKFTFAALKGWHDRARSTVFGLPGVVLTDVDDRANRVVIGVQDVESHGPEVKAHLAKLGIPVEAVEIEQVAMPKPELRDLHRPVVGGLQIEWRSSPFDFPWNRPLCTLGYNANRNGVRGYVTNSHCTANRGSVDGGNHYQPAGSNLIALLGVERADPGLFTGSPCPEGWRCRLSDAAWMEYTGPNASSSLGRIAAPPNGSFTWDGVATLRIVGERIPLVGEGVARIGRTTGRRPGVVTRTCVSTGVADEPNVAILCQEMASYVSDGGDSGSPVVQFTTASDVRLAGIHWGSNDVEAVYSGFDTVEFDLGALQTF